MKSQIPRTVTVGASAWSDTAGTARTEELAKTSPATSRRMTLIGSIIAKQSRTSTSLRPNGQWLSPKFAQPGKPLAVHSAPATLTKGPQSIVR